ncbi:M28 family metallopeptidase [Streptomyces sp. NBC_01795]|uniref:M28 family metallopeptidase n=1 Tax=Streptomyces sp. NBC_01795 TaxID=2975943 RepID=UPI002DD94B9D|nr:M28 family metallopeptidase [Streptomyces sp. NBC_01795]WSA93771.1 M28 family metallopeptidase [Streptomyces sp. NBC_01795]
MHVPLRTLRSRSVAALAATALAAPLLLASSATAGGAGSHPGKEGDKLAAHLVQRTSGKGALKHLIALRAIAEASDGNRAAGSKGHDRSAKYAGALLKQAGYKVSYEKFEFTYRKTLAEKLSVLTPEQRDVPVTLMTYTKSTPEGGLKAPVAAVPVDTDGSSGCEAADYAGGDYQGKIALIERGTCSFAQKQATAADAGAAGAVIYNNVAGELNGTLGDPESARIPTGGVGQADGEALAELVAKGGVSVNLEVREFQEQRTTPNVIAETKGGDPDNVVMLGAHLDSVPEGPGINDNGSGSAGILETALQLAKADHKGKHANKVRFALWSAEELGLLGAEEYVKQLPAAEREKIALYLNFDMIASPNYGIFAYDGDDSDGTGSGPGPEGSAKLEKDLAAFLKTRGLATRGTDFDGRSDYGPFIDAGIPSGGTFTGAEGIKTAEEKRLWGGTAGAAYDSCYHQSCDGLKNISLRAFDANVKAIANAVGHYAWDTTGLPTAAPKPAASRPKSGTNSPSVKATSGPYKGPWLVR